MSGITTSFFLIFAGAAVLASLALYTRQPLIIAYIVLGAVIGPYGVEWVTDLKLLADIADVGILFLLFLLGLDMQPRALIDTIQKSTVVALLSSLAFAAMGIGIASLFGFTLVESLVIGAAMMFSSTIIGIKLLPTTVLHHKHTGELMIGLLLLQDLIAIFVLLLLMSFGLGEFSLISFSLTLLSLPLLVAAAFAAVRWVVLPLLRRFDRFHEYIFLVALGWCLGLAEAGHALGLSAEIGAFLAGISLATSPISQYIAVNLKPLRDFFLILFFFSLGARFDLGLLGEVLLPAMVLATTMLCLKPVIFRYLLHGLSERNSLAWDLGFRLGQVSEFSLLIAYMAAGSAIIGREASHLIQATTIITFVVSSYIIILNYPTPIAIADRLRRD
ncbi:MAG: sodium:proton antiporter [Spongiibacteraceae bacterium]|nr:sodium:proton antiporter [Spongiibacteraceae bacterium]